MTALHIAVHHKHAAVVQELVKKPEKEVLNARDHVSWCMQAYYIGCSIKLDLIIASWGGG